MLHDIKNARIHRDITIIYPIKIPRIAWQTNQNVECEFNGIMQCDWPAFIYFSYLYKHSILCNAMSSNLTTQLSVISILRHMYPSEKHRCTTEPPKIFRYKHNTCRTDGYRDIIYFLFHCMPVNQVYMTTMRLCVMHD